MCHSILPSAGWSVCNAAPSPLSCYQNHLPPLQFGGWVGEEGGLACEFPQTSTIFLLDFPCLSPEPSRWCSAATNTRAQAAGCSHLGCVALKVYRHTSLIPDGFPFPTSSFPLIFNWAFSSWSFLQSDPGMGEDVDSWDRFPSFFTCLCSSFWGLGSFYTDHLPYRNPNCATMV